MPRRKYLHNVEAVSERALKISKSQRGTGRHDVPDVRLSLPFPFSPSGNHRLRSPRVPLATVAVVMPSENNLQPSTPRVPLALAGTHTAGQFVSPLDHLGVDPGFGLFECQTCQIAAEATADTLGSRVLLALRIVTAGSPQAVREVPPYISFLGLCPFLDERNTSCFPLCLRGSDEPRKSINLDVRSQVTSSQHEHPRRRRRRPARSSARRPSRSPPQQRRQLLLNDLAQVDQDCLEAAVAALVRVVAVDFGLWLRVGHFGWRVGRAVLGGGVGGAGLGWRDWGIYAVQHNKKIRKHIL